LGKAAGIEAQRLRRTGIEAILKFWQSTPE